MVCPAVQMMASSYQRRAARWLEGPRWQSATRALAAV
jgi:hypothetical protein